MEEQQIAGVHRFIARSMKIVLLVSVTATLLIGAGSTTNAVGASSHPAENRVPPPLPQQVATRLDAHPCLGEWVGTLVASTGQRAQGSVSVRGISGDCGGFVEQWHGSITCRYQLSSCQANGPEIRAQARDPRGPIMGGCNPVSVTLTCDEQHLRFLEVAPHSTISSVMARRPSP